MVFFFRNLMKYKYYFIGIILVAIAVNYFFVIRNFEPTYLSQTTLLISRRGVETEPNVLQNQDDAVQEDQLFENTQELLQSFQVSERLVNDIPGIIISTQVLDEINRRLAESQVGISSYSMINFRDQLTTEIITNSRIVEVSIANKDAAAAQLITQTIAETTRQIVIDIYGQDYVNIIKVADEPRQPDGIVQKHLWIIGAFGGILIGFLLILIITIVNNHQLDGRDESYTTHSYR